MSSNRFYQERREMRVFLGLCSDCGAREPREQLKSCVVCSARYKRKARAWTSDGRDRTRSAKRNRTPTGWSNQRAADHRTRVRQHNVSHPDSLLLEKIIDGPSLLAHIVVHGPTCGLCGIHTGFPWEHVGKETGPEVDHILSMWAIINEGRQDWASVSNVRLLCVSCHSTEGIRLKRQDIEERAHMDRMLGKDDS